MGAYLSLKEKFESKAKILKDPNPCWMWTGAKIKSGYGVIRIYSGFKKYAMCGAHRVSWMIYFGDIPEKMWVLHKCDNPSCVNPNHLFLGTPKQNTWDMILKNRQARGSKSGTAVLSEEKVIAIRRLKKHMTQKQMARLFGVCSATIAHAATGRNWKWLT